MTPEQRERLRIIIRDSAVVRGEFVLSSGRPASYYVDLRLVTLAAEGAYLSALAMLDLVADLRPDAIGGPTMAADPMAGAIAAVSHATGRPVKGFMVRKAQKSHGTQRTVEGPLEKGDRCVVVDDTVTTGGSLLQAIAEVEAAGGVVVAVATLMDREEGARETFAAKGYLFRSAFSFKELGIVL